MELYGIWLSYSQFCHYLLTFYFKPAVFIYLWNTKRKIVRNLYAVWAEAHTTSVLYTHIYSLLRLKLNSLKIRCRISSVSQVFTAENSMPM